MYQTSPSIKLAPELLSNICSNLDKPGLKLARLVCKAFDGAAVPMLFDRVYVASRYADLEVARLVAARFRPFIKTLVYSTECYPIEYSLRDFKAAVVAEDLDEHYSNFDQGNNPLRLYWKSYCRLKREHDEIIYNDEISGTLCHLFNNLPHLRRVVFSDQIRQRSYCPCSQAILDFSSRTYDPIFLESKCNFVPNKIQPHDTSQCLRLTSGFIDAKSSPWHEILVAISITTCASIKEMTMDPALRDSGLCWEAFSLTPRQAWHARKVLRNLVTLNLSLDSNEDSGNEPEFKGLEQALSWATGLEHLEIKIHGITRSIAIQKLHDGVKMDFSACIEGIKLPKLRTLALSGFWVHEETLVNLFGGTSSMKRVFLEEITLISGAWSSLVERMRQLLELVSIEVFGLNHFSEDEGGLHFVFPEETEDIDLDLERHKALSLELERYFRHGGRNPFNEYKYQPMHDSENSL